MNFRDLILPVLAFTFATIAPAQDVDPINASTAALSQAALEYQAIDTAFDGRNSDTQAQTLQDRAVLLKQTTMAQVGLLETQLALIDARVAQLGSPTPGVIEAPDIHAQRALLTRQRSAVDSAIKRGKLLGIETDQLIAEIGQSKAQAFSERMSVRVASPLTPDFWRAFVQSLPRDGKRFSLYMRVEGQAIARGISSGWPGALIGLILAVALMGPVRIGLRTAGRRYVINRAPGSRIRRSGLALWLVFVGTLIPGLAAISLLAGLRAAGMIAPAWDALSRIVPRVAIIAALISALGGALLQRRQSSWRLIDLSDDTANRLRPWTFAAAGVTLLSVLLTAIRDGLGASGPAQAVVDSAAATLYIALVFGVLATAARLRSKMVRETEEERGDQSIVAGISLLTWAMLAVSVISILSGYIAFGYFLARFIVWIAVVASTLYLLLISVDDICSTAFVRDGRIADALHHGFGVRRSLIDQFGVVLSALLRLALILVALGMVFKPFGSDVSTLFGQIGRVAQGVTIGQITISPGAILRSFAVLLVGLFVVRVLQRWLTTRYLPATELDAGARNSIAMVARYSGLILATLWALASLGIGIERIALLLSALSVGIGFGLQAITQNFVSGLILLAERPVKIGDWVRIGDQEGDVKRISVRATEIQIADRSTLIVPNSELITKSIVNKTLSDPIGRIQLQFSVPLGTDVAQVKAMLQAMFRDAPAILDDPDSKIFVDSIADGRVYINAFAYVRSPRDVYPTRSDLFFQLLQQMPEAGIELGTTPQQMQWIGAPPIGAQGPIEANFTA
jgi:small-conductance mechanosensitive channel